MLPIKNLNGETHLLTNIKQITRRRAVNGERKIDFLVVPGEKNEHAWDSVDFETETTFMGDPYIIKDMEEASVGERSIKKVEAVHTFYNTMINSYQHKVHSGSMTFFAALTHVFEETPYDFSIVDSFYSQRFENFGDDNCLAMFETVLGRYGAEFRLVGNRVYLEEEIGEQTNFQFRWKNNVKSISKSVSTKGLSNVIRGYGGTPNDAGVYPLVYDYRSPNEALFPTMDYVAKSYYNENITTEAGMITALQREITDEPQLSITVDIAETGLQTVSEGDRGFIIYEPMNLTLSARVVEVIDTFQYLDGDWRLIKTAVTLSNIKDKLSDVTTRFAQTSKRVERLFEGKEALPYNVLPEAMRIAAEAINNSLTEVQYPAGQGIVLQDPDNENNLVRLTSAGIGLSTDGGQTYRSALTGAGIVTNELVAGIIRTNNIQIVGENDLFYWNGEGLFAYNPNDLTKFVRLNSNGLYIAKGAITIERPDGYKTIDNGISTFDVNIQGVEPTFHSPAVTLVQKSYAQWLSTRTASASVDFNQYSFKHDARYLKVRFRVLASSGATAHFEIWRGGERVASSQTGVTDENDPSVVNGSTLTVDLGVPTGAASTFQIRFRTSESNVDAYAMVTRKWLEG